MQSIDQETSASCRHYGEETHTILLGTQDSHENQLSCPSRFKETQFSGKDDIMGDRTLTIRHRICFKEKNQLRSSDNFCGRIELACRRGYTFIISDNFK